MKMMNPKIAVFFYGGWFFLLIQSAVKPEFISKSVDKGPPVRAINAISIKNLLTFHRVLMAFYRNNMEINTK